jgi:murein DD-endopeptidase MepM/ murein hydrolase activator NlpD
MEAGHLLRRSRTRRFLVRLTAAALILTWIAPASANAADQRLEEATGRRVERQARLDELYQQQAALTADQERLVAELNELTARLEDEQAEADAAQSALELRIRQSYMNGSSEPTLALLASGSAQDATEQARLLALLNRRGQGEVEGATAARVRTEAAAEDVRVAQAAVDANRAQLDTALAEAERLVAEAEAEEREIGDQIALEQRAALLAANGDFQGAAGPSGQVNGDIACPIGDPVSYRDTWGAARSGGRSHRGVDMLSPIGTPIYAYENGVISRKNSGGLGGTSIYLQGDSGNLYYYTHLSGYVSGVDVGDRVTAGQHIAFNGDSGNAAGIPHLHFEVMPGGGSNVNPYPYAFQACG